MTTMAQCTPYLLDAAIRRMQLTFDAVLRAELADLTDAQCKDDHEANRYRRWLEHYLDH